MRTHTPRTLYDKWNSKYESKKERINMLKKRRKIAGKGELPNIEGELEELYVESNLLQEVLIDVGIMVYRDESRY